MGEFTRTRRSGGSPQRTPSLFPDTVRYVDPFCGAGGLSLGLKQAGLEPVFSIDCNRAAVRTYRAALGNHVHEGPISDDIELPDADVIVGGPPCQGFSSAGLRRQGDERNTLVSCFARIVARKRPTAFVFENVEGFLTSEDGTHVLDLLTHSLRPDTAFKSER